MPPAAGVSLRASRALREGELWSALSQGLQERGVPWEAVDEEALGLPPGLVAGRGAGHGDAPVSWAYLESDFVYAAHRTTCSEVGAGVGRDGREDAVGTRFPLVLLFEPATSLEEAPRALGNFVAWLRTAPRHFDAHTRILLILVGGQHVAGLRQGHADALAACLVEHGVGAVEVHDADNATQYVLQCAASVAERRRRRVPSRFKAAGVGLAARAGRLCSDENPWRLVWVSQLMQVAGVSEEIAKAVAGRHASPVALMEAAAALGTSATSAVADSFLADLEYPIRGKKGTRRVGPVVSRRLFALFHPATLPEHVLL